MLPRKVLEIRCYEMATETILGQKQSRGYYTQLAEYCIQFLAVHVDLHNILYVSMHFQKECMTPSCSFRLIVGGDSLEGQLANFRAPEIVIYFARIYLRPCFHLSGVHRLRPFRIHQLVLHKQTGCVAATKLVWTALILNVSEASGPPTNGRGQMYSYRRCIYLFVRATPLDPPPPPPSIRASHCMCMSLSKYVQLEYAMM